MIVSEPVLNVLLYSALAAALAGLGALPFATGGRPRPVWIGVASALAAGLMLGAGYLLLDLALDRGSLPALAGGATGVLYTLAARVFIGAGDRIGEPVDAEAPALGWERTALVLVQHGLHAAAEGLAIGVAMVLNLRLGIFVTLGLAVHNIGEAMALTDGLRHREVSTGRAAALSILINLPQPVLALAVFALAPALDGLLPGALGFAAGSLVFLVLTELVPGAYPQAGRRWVAVLVSGSAGAVVLLEAFFVG